ncbi:MAG: GlsB/YeaQ/YmgE family stress response membrane protein [Treponema sp.]|nr:GlsB/YeaQ/YmgE family stress response membrane protein [Treponema sp.]
MILSIVLTILIGALVGWLAGLLMKSKHGFWMNCLLGIVGSFIGWGIASALGFGATNLIATILVDIGGTCLLIAIVRAILGKKF